MLKRTSVWVGTLAFCITVWIGIALAARAFGDEPKAEPTITGWVHIFGCPRASDTDDTNNDILVIFNDGQVVHLHQHALTQEQKDNIAKLLTMRGLNLIYDCGAQS